MSQNRQIRVYRDEMELGVLPEEDVKTLLSVGFLKPTDSFWTEGMQRPLGLAEFSAGETSNLKKQAINITRAVTQKAGKLADRVRELTVQKTKTISAVKEKALESFLPQIKEIVSGVLKSKPITAARSSLHDDEFMTKVFGAAYDCLPKPVQRFVDEERFIAFCRLHRQKLLDS